MGRFLCRVLHNVWIFQLESHGVCAESRNVGVVVVEDGDIWKQLRRQGEQVDVALWDFCEAELGLPAKPRVMEVNYLGHVVVHACKVGSVHQAHSRCQIDHLLEHIEEVHGRLNVMLLEGVDDVLHEIFMQWGKHRDTRHYMLDAKERE